MADSRSVAARLLFMLGLMAATWSVWSASSASGVSLQAVLAEAQAPAGVVFEIVDRDEQALAKALPWVAEAAKALRGRFADLPLAVVTHGREMFALKEGAKGGNEAVHNLAQELSQGQHIPIHVCETYASRRGLMPEDFPKYIDVAPEGPAQLRNYEALGYVRIKVPKTSAMGQ